jgi:hypothetical protein
MRLENKGQKVELPATHPADKTQTQLPLRSDGEGNGECGYIGCENSGSRALKRRLGERKKGLAAGIVFRLPCTKMGCGRERRKKNDTNNESRD